jgi:hypothetical protein
MRCITLLLIASVVLAQLPIEEAVFHGDVETLAPILADPFADLNARLKHKATPLILASVRGERPLTPHRAKADRYFIYRTCRGGAPAAAAGQASKGERQRFVPLVLTFKQPSLSVCFLLRSWATIHDRGGLQILTYVWLGGH